MTDRRPFFLEGIEILVGIANNGAYAAAVDLTDPENYEHFWDQYRKGNWLTIDLYTLPKKEIPNCQGEGQVPASDLKGKI